MKNSYFLDPSFSIALIVEKDQFHQRAMDLASEIAERNAEIITTQAILLEIGNALSKRRHRKAAVSVLQELESDLKTTIIGLTPDLYDRVLQLFSSRMDKEWGLVDCISFVIMRKLDIETALTTDNHFIQAGFRALLRED
jgi:predicted nucleic acid-binding protein